MSNKIPQFMVDKIHNHLPIILRTCNTPLFDKPYLFDVVGVLENTLAYMQRNSTEFSSDEIKSVEIDLAWLQKTIQDN